MNLDIVKLDKLICDANSIVVALGPKIFLKNSQKEFEENFFWFY
ncbi:hypothetical protein [Mycoplasma capricolum]|nr:hypothetical protein Mccp14020TZ_05370 [Mycoplasma capricolum subsp. capripneumoniae]